MRDVKVRTGAGRFAVALLALLAVVGACSGTSRGVADGTAQSASATARPPVTDSRVAGTSSHPATSDPVTSRSGESPSVSSHTPGSADTATTTSPTRSTDGLVTTPSKRTAPSPTPTREPDLEVIASPPFGSTGISPTEPLTIRVTSGTIRKLTFSNPSEGITVNGTMSSDRAKWALTEALGYGKTYTVHGMAVANDGMPVPITGTYSTVAPKREISTIISPGDDAVVGVAAPIIIRFSAPPPDRALIEKHIAITTSTPVTGAWAWVTHDGDTYPSLDFRPKKYWPEHTKVHVETDLYGVKLADGTYGGDNVTVDFTIGRNQVVIANAKSKKIVVQRDGKTTATYPASYGMGDDPNSKFGINPDLVTRSGIHIVMDKKPKVLMSLPKYGYTNIPEYWDVRISDNGEFIHENPTTVADQGFLNVTHGCINLSPASAKAYYHSAIYGDPVEVSGTSVQLSPKDGDIFDWAVSWPVWTSLSNTGEFTTTSG